MCILEPAHTDHTKSMELAHHLNEYKLLNKASKILLHFTYRVSFTLLKETKLHCLTQACNFMLMYIQKCIFIYLDSNTHISFLCF